MSQQNGPPIMLPLLHQPTQSRNNELVVAKTQKTPKHRSKDKDLGSPLSSGQNAVIGPFISIPEVNNRKASLNSGREPKTPQKQHRDAQQTNSNKPAPHQNQYSAGQNTTTIELLVKNPVLAQIVLKYYEMILISFAKTCLMTPIGFSNGFNKVW